MPPQKDSYETETGDGRQRELSLFVNLNDANARGSAAELERAHKRLASLRTYVEHFETCRRTFTKKGCTCGLSGLLTEIDNGGR